MLNATRVTDDASGVQTTMTRHERTGAPFISFVCLRTFSDGTEAIDENPSIAGGISADVAARVVAELKAALAYIRQEG